MVEVGQRFPSFSLQNEMGEIIANDALKGAKAILYFYPKDDTPGCTVEANEFKEVIGSFQYVRVFGISPDSIKSHQKFIKKFDLPFSLLADVDHKLAEACGIWVEKSMYGKKYMGVERTTFLIDQDGVVQEIWRKVKPEGHAADVQACALK